ncbi:MAG TPA: copper chaperone [Gemmatimonas aurantiaca]|uniref:Heavy metal-binding protein n=2 Tax=Gemmatimonas aurantiaca TaxID=173480 RepID=C1ABR9_GEMAT|nr:heavy-metal-associated domain-containing protein [Gemmatimonas aurantiaca]BAH39946.1 heavy metal-binding protein [Gemmatimonas aurantiaca T-27]HCT58045.1 copper chaperone [Gemmatimonas aurantiaca]
MQSLKLEISGMSCGHCVKAVDKALSKVDGVTVQSVGVGEATVSFDPSRATSQQLAEAVADAGFQLTGSH